MSVKQISIFVPNKPGQLSEVTTALADNGVNLRAFSIADTSDFGILRIIVEDVDAAAAMLKEQGFIYTVTDVLACAMKDERGGLAQILRLVASAGVSTEYAYAFVSVKAGACVIVRVDDNEAAAKALKAAGIRIAEQEELF